MKNEYLAVDDFLTYLKSKENIDITKRTLRYYAAEGILPPPVKIGGNRAYYSTYQITKLKTILMLKACGKSIKEIRNVITSDMSITPEDMKRVENGVVDKIADEFKGVVAKSYSKRKYERNEHSRILERINDRLECHPELETTLNYLPFLEQVTALLNRSSCVIPRERELNKILKIREIIEIAFKLEGGLNHRDAYYRKTLARTKIRAKKLKDTIKTIVEKLYKNHIKYLQEELLKLQNL